MESFLHLVEVEYLPNSYHNNIHGADVTQTAAIIMHSLEKVLPDIPKMDAFCIIIGASVHDLGHLGVNNDFLISSRHPRATAYNDRSVNENYHVSRAFELARSIPGCDIFESFTSDEQKKVRLSPFIPLLPLPCVVQGVQGMIMWVFVLGGAALSSWCCMQGYGDRPMRLPFSHRALPPLLSQCRKLMIDTVLATDMAIHFDLLKSFSAALDAQPDVRLWPDRNLLYQMLLHLADIANPSRPFGLARGWAERVIVEFCEQVRHWEGNLLVGHHGEKGHQSPPSNGSSCAPHVPSHDPPASPPLLHRRGTRKKA